MLLQMTFELESKALHWVQERRRNLLAERTGRAERLQLKEQAKRRRREEQAQRLAEEQAQRRRHEEDQLRREEEERLDEFRRRRQQDGTAELAATSASGAETPATATAPAAAPSPPPGAVDAASATADSSPALDSDGTASAALAPSVAANPEPRQAQGPQLDAAATAGSARLPRAVASPAADQCSPVTVVSANPFNPFRGPVTTVLKPQSWQHQQADGLSGAHRPDTFNYRDFESQASDPFDSAELKTINDMEELASVFRPLAATAACSQPQLDGPSHHPQQSTGPHGHQYQPPVAATGSGAGYTLTGGYPSYPSANYTRPAYSGALEPAKAPAHRYTGGGGYAPAAPAATARPSSLAAPSLSGAPAATDACQLHEFYARYYGPPAGGGPRLRSSRSVPDLSEPPDAAAGLCADGSSARRTKSHTPPPAPCTSGPLPPAQVGQGAIGRPLMCGPCPLGVYV